MDRDRTLAWVKAERLGRVRPGERVAQLPETAGSARRAPLSSPVDPLVDALVHGQDVAPPLGRERAMPPEQTAAALGHVLASLFYGARKRLSGTPADVSAGDRQGNVESWAMTGGGDGRRRGVRGPGRSGRSGWGHGHGRAPAAARSELPGEIRTARGAAAHLAVVARTRPDHGRSAAGDRRHVLCG